MRLGSKVIIEKLFFIAGLTAGMTCIGIYSENGGITLFTLVQFLLVLSGLLLKYPHIMNDRIKSPFFVLVVCIFLSPLINLAILPEMWRNNSLRDLLSNIAGLTSFYLLFNKDDLIKCGPHFIKGLKINFVIQAIWAIAQFIAGHFYNISINYAIGLYMPKVLPVTEVSGLTWERAELSVVLILGYILFKDKLSMRILALVALLLTGSRTALIMGTILVLFTFNYKKVFLRKGGKGIDLKSVSVVFVAFFLIVYFRQPIVELYNNTFNSILNYKDNASGVGHLELYKNVPLILKNISLPSLLLGFSGGCSGYPYSTYMGRNVGYVWSVESTILSYFFSYGIIGFTAWIVWMFGSAKKCVDSGQTDIGKLFYIIIIGSFFYALLSNWGLTALIILADYRDDIQENDTIRGSAYEKG